MTAAAHLPHVWTRLEYERLVDSGGLHPESRVELVDGDILEYWILNLPDGVLEVHRDPVGETYASRSVLAASERIAPLHAQGNRTLAVAEVLP
jgi:hypothetical protein